MHKRYRISLLLLCLLLGSEVMAAANITEVTEHMMVPVIMITELGYSVCYIVGTGLVIGSLLRYKDYRKNPVHVRLTQPILLFIFGMSLILLPIIAQLSSAAPSYSGQYQSMEQNI